MLKIIQQNQLLIEQATGLISDIQPTLYRQCCEEVFSSSIGQHMRHCIEHYDELFLAHADKQVIRYHARPRNIEVETDPAMAVSRLRFIYNQLDRTDGDNISLRVSDGGISGPAKSSLARELEFLVSHTVHHFALIAVIAKKLQIEVPQDFGIAPTTLNYRKSN